MGSLLGMRFSRIKKHPWLGLLAISAPWTLAGCGSERGLGAQTAAPAPARAQAPAAQKAAAGGEVVIPSTGQAVDTKRAVDVVKAEVQGGEADANSPTPPEFLYQEADESLIRDEPYELVAPAGLSQVVASVPEHNPMTKGKVALGKQLYYDQRLSLDATVSCASCHDPARGWTDNRKASIGIGNQIGARNSPTVLNTTLGKSMFWDGRSPHLEGQAQGPIQNKIEMGDQSYRQIVERLRAVPGYRDQFRTVFGTDVTLDGIAKAIACFERTALSGDSPYDQYIAGDPDEEATFAKLTLPQKRGMLLFGLTLQPDDPDTKKVDPKTRKRANCTACHSGENFTDEQFHNLGVGFDASKGQFADLGRWVISPVGTKSKAERGAFKTPTVRDAARTFPYMHDGSEATLEAVVEFYNKGGNKNPALDRNMAPLNLTEQEKADLVAFMQALTGKEIKVAVPALPAGADGKSPDPTAALNNPGKVATAQASVGTGRLVLGH